MGVKLVSASGGSVELVAPATATNYTQTLPANSGTVLTNKTAGTVLQVVQGTLSVTASTTSTTDVSSGLTASITPTSATSKILVLVNGGKAYIAANNYIPCTLYRNGVSLGAAARYTPAEGNPVATNHSLCYLDSPATTASTTYTVYYRTSSTATAYFSDAPAASGQVNITLMEIAA